MKRSFCYLLAAGVSVASVEIAVAQSEEAFDLGVIRIEADDAQGVLGNAQITSEEIEARNPASMKEVFIGESAVTSSGGAAIGQKVFVHGIEESLLSVTIDGARQNKSAFHHTGNILIDPALLKSVEISSGLAPADAGPGALAGSLAYQTKDARDLLEDGKAFGATFSLGGGTNGYGMRGTASVYGADSRFEYLLSTTRHSGSDYEDGSGRLAEGTEPEIASYLAKIAYTSQGGHRLSFAASRTEDTGKRAAQPGPGGLLFIRPDFFGVFDRFTGLPVDNILVEGLSRRTSYTLTYEDEQPEGWFAPKVQLSYNEQEIDAVAIYGANKSFSGFFQNEFSLSNGTVTAGLDFFHESASGDGRALGSTGKESIVSVGVFAQARQDIGERFSVSYGGRYDFQAFDAADGSEFSDNGASVNAAVDVILTDTLTLNAGVASSWGGFELGEAALINIGGPWTYDGFTTSRANNARIGLRFDNGPWEASGALFYTKISDLNAVLPRADGRGARGDVESKGVDASLGYDWGQGFARLNYTYADVTLDGNMVSSTDFYVGRPVGHLIGLEAAWDATNSLRLGGTAEIAPAFSAAAEAEDSVGLSGYEVLNLFAEYRPQRVDNVLIRFDIRNAFNADYISRGSDGASRASQVQALHEPGRSFAINTTFTF